VHDRLEAGDAAFRLIDDLPDRAYRQIHEQGMIGDLGQPGTRDDLPAACGHCRAHFIFPCLGLNLRGSVDQFDLQRDKLVLAALLDLLGEKTGVDSLDPVLRPPWSQIAKQFEHATPRRLPELQLIGVPAPPKREQFCERACVRNKEVGNGLLVVVAA